MQRISQSAALRAKDDQLDCYGLSKFVGSHIQICRQHED